MPAKKDGAVKEKFFPTFAVILLVVGIVWFLSELNVITVDVPWVPLVVIIIAVGMLFNRYRGKR